MILVELRFFYPALVNRHRQSNTLALACQILDAQIPFAIIAPMLQLLEPRQNFFGEEVIDDVGNYLIAGLGRALKNFGQLHLRPVVRKS